MIEFPLGFQKDKLCNKQFGICKLFFHINVCIYPYLDAFENYAPKFERERERERERGAQMDVVQLVRLPNGDKGSWGQPLHSMPQWHLVN